MNRQVYRYIHEWTHEERSLVFHTLPMFHIGTIEYYTRIHQIIDSCNHILLEGVNLKNTKELGTYRRVAKAVQLVAQIDALVIPKDIDVTNIDIKDNIFENLYHKLPLIYKINILLIELALRNIRIFKSEKLKEYLYTANQYREENKYELINPKNHIPFKYKPKSKLKSFFESSRNIAIQSNLIKFIDNNSNLLYRYDVGIIFGDSHMPYIYEVLLGKQFKWKLEERIVVF